MSIDASRPIYVPPSGPRPKIWKNPLGNGSRPLPRRDRRRGSAQQRRIKRQLAITALAITLTLLAGMFIALNIVRAFGDLGGWAIVPWSLAYLAFAISVGVLLYGGLVYQVARAGYFLRKRHDVSLPDDVLDQFSDSASAPSVTVLVPSYRESTTTISQTLLSAALQDYPNKRVVLLIDDPTDSDDPADSRLLDDARRIPQDIQHLVDDARATFGRFAVDFAEQEFDPEAAPQLLADAHNEVAAWFEDRASETPARDHTDRLFVRIVLQDAARDLRHRAQRFAAMPSVNATQAERAYQRLARRFDVEVTSFERKRFVNLSHEPNKAMNLNTYIGLLGRSLRVERHHSGLHLVNAAPDDADLTIPRPDFVLTLDADSMLAHRYIVRLLEMLDRPGNERLAVAQSPYSAVPGAPGAVERIAGATTDIMYVWQQGSTYFDAAYWIGANAIIRTAALEEIAEHGVERGFPVTKFIQDYTLIEDTESTVDLITRGWKVYNYPERLAFSATPPDFGSLLIQRRRWANGGLLILPKLLRYLMLPSQRRLSALGEAFMRFHYVISEAAVNTGLVVVFALSMITGLFNWWIVISALPYFALYAIDLKQSGYTWPDMLRVYAMNLLLIPVNLAGMINSLRQAATGEKVPFGRTPKVSGRTVAPPIYIASEYVMLGVVLVVGAGLAFYYQNILYGSFSLLNGVFLAYAIVAFIGLRESWDDLRDAQPARQASNAVPATSQPAHANGHGHRRDRPMPTWAWHRSQLRRTWRPSRASNHHRDLDAIH